MLDVSDRIFRPKCPHPTFHRFFFNAWTKDEKGDRLKAAGLVLASCIDCCLASGPVCWSSNFFLQKIPKFHRNGQELEDCYKKLMMFMIANSKYIDDIHHQQHLLHKNRTVQTFWSQTFRGLDPEDLEQLDVQLLHHARGYLRDL